MKRERERERASLRIVVVSQVLFYKILRSRVTLEMEGLAQTQLGGDPHGYLLRAPSALSYLSI